MPLDARALLHVNPALVDRVRLAIMAALAASENRIDFNGLLQILELTKGNLSSHLRKLEDAGLIEVKKEFVDRKPLTTYRCTAAGKKELNRYLQGIEAVLQQGTPVRRRRTRQKGEQEVKKD